MAQPIRIHYDGHAHANELPIPNEDDDVLVWRQALDYVTRYIAPHGPTFHLFGRGRHVFFRDGVADQDDLGRLDAHLFEAARHAEEQPAASTKTDL